MDVVIINYNAGNICSVDYALRRIGVEPIISGDPEVIRRADKVLFPGQGEAAMTMQYLRDRQLDRVICELTQPLLGICVGMQLLCRHSEEGDTAGLGIFDANVKRFLPKRKEEKVPHMGWNELVDLKGPLFAPEWERSYVYYVHSYYVPLSPDTVATTEYIQPFSAAMQKDNYYATQFHPEKSGLVGEAILRRFINL